MTLQGIARSLLFLPLFFVGLIAFMAGGMIFMPIGLLWVISVFWLLIGQWIAKALGIKAAELDDTKDFSYMIFVICGFSPA